MIIAVKARFKTKIVEAATGRVVKEQPWKENLVLDNALNALAQQAAITGMPVCRPANCNLNIILGSGTDANSVSSGAVTFTQSGTTLTASAGFFTAGMVGWLFKWGTGSGGNEIRITAFGSTTSVTVDTSATVSTPDVGTVWNVARTALQTPLTLAATSYQTNSGDCGTTFSAPAVTFKRTYIVPQQVSPYSVNEIGWNSGALGNTTNGIGGRFVLGSTDSVGTSNFYVVVMEITFTQSPGSPTAVSNVGTNINTAGNAMIEFIGMATVATTGLLQAHGAGLDSLDGTNSVSLCFPTVTYSQNGSINNSNGVNIGSSRISPSGTASWTKVGGTIGVMAASFNGSASTSGESLFGIAIHTGTGVLIFDIKFTSTQTAPVGTFTPVTVFRVTYGRTLTN